MADAAAHFFEALSRREYEPLLAKARGTIRFDLAESGATESWLVELDRGRVSVSRGAGAADCVVRTDRPLFAGLAAGSANPLAAYLRGELTVDGDPTLLVLFRRVLPGPASERP